MGFKTESPTVPTHVFFPLQADPTQTQTHTLSSRAETVATAHGYGRADVFFIPFRLGKQRMRKLARLPDTVPEKGELCVVSPGYKACGSKNNIPNKASEWLYLHPHSFGNLLHGMAGDTYKWG